MKRGEEKCKSMVREYLPDKESWDANWQEKNLKEVEWDSKLVHCGGQLKR